MIHEYQADIPVPAMLVTRSDKRPLVFGEVLFDRFSDDTVVLGGAPFNVAWHLQGFGLAPILVSRVGSDQLGDQIFEKMTKWGMDTRAIQRDAQFPTGTVEIKLEKGQPTFSILPDQAYDYIDQAVCMAALDSVDIGMIYHGSLALRNKQSANALSWIRSQVACPVFVDVNLREPWWSTNSIEQFMRGAEWVKLNDDELAQLMGNNANTEEKLRELGQEFRTNHKLDLLIITRGAAGAWVLSDNGWIRGEPVVVDNVIDTVGAGDAFSAVMILGLVQGWDIVSTLPKALEFAAEICRTRGATTADKQQYQNLFTRWSMA